MADKQPNRIKECRSKHHYTQKMLADYLHVHQTAVSQWENGKTEPDVRNLSRMSGLFSVSVEYLMGITEGRTVQESTPREEVAQIMTDLSPEELQRVCDFVSGLKASRAK